jgi:hypothetical protein
MAVLAGRKDAIGCSIFSRGAQSNKTVNFIVTINNINLKALIYLFC